MLQALSAAAAAASAFPGAAPLPDMAFAHATAASALPNNMNGEYVYSSTPGARNTLPKQFKDFPSPSGAPLEYFDVYTPAMTTLYSQVWWKALDPASFPDDIIKRYNGTSMAIVGWEIDQVRKNSQTGEDESVPISASYNHHYVAQVIGGSAKFKKIEHFDGPDDPRLEGLTVHGMPIPWDQPHYMVEDDEKATASSSSSSSSKWGLTGSHHQQFSSGNGGEYRKTFHGFPPGYALVLDSPTAFQVTPMQIDTWHRELMPISGGKKARPAKFVPGPLPRGSLAPPNAKHSGLLECPMTTRLTKVVEGDYVTQSDSGGGAACAATGPILTYHECYYAAATALQANYSYSRLINETAPSANRPPGCSYSTSKGTPVYVFFNEDSTSAVPCGPYDVCVCPKEKVPFGQAKGALLYRNTGQKGDIGNGTAAHFSGQKCASWPATDLLNHTNPTCDIRYYKGGQWACSHGWSLLDADQTIPWPDQPLVFHHKYRFWVQPYVPTFHTKLTLGEMVGSALLIGSPWEFDVPKCGHGVPGCSLVNGSQWIHTVTGSMMGRHTFVSLNNHCHAPTCLSMRVYACPKGTPLEQCNTSNGKLICRTDPVYGGTGNPAISGDPRFDEEGYIAIPDCFWSDKAGPIGAYGLAPPVDLDGVPLHVVKMANATWGHYGEMAGGQPWVY